MKYRRIVILFLFLWYSSGVTLQAQFYSSGQDPASYKWYQAKSDKARFVFPEQFQEHAINLINGSDSLFDAVSISMDHHPRRIDILFHTGDVISNGFVSWAPSRSEIYTTPPQDAYGNAWLHYVLLHEYRHIVQVDKLNRGLTRNFSWILGEQAIGAVLGLYLPLWFLEGDAVIAETALTKSGRGRIPSFSAPLRAQLDRYGKYDYEKAYFGSYRDFVPNHYILGYHLTALPRLKYGPEIWSEAINRAAEKPWSIRPVSSAIKEISGQNLQEIYRSSMDELGKLWDEDPSLRSPGKQIKIPESSHYTSYHRPHLMPDGSIIAAKMSIDDIDRIVRITPQGEETVLATPGSWFRESLDTKGDLVVWTERRPHPRWENKAWSEIHVLNIATGKKQRTGIKGRYFAPAVQPGGKEVGAIRIYEDLNFEFVTLDIETGKQGVMRTDRQNYIQWMQPAWHPDGLKVVVIAQYPDGKKTLLLIDLAKGIQPPLIKPGHTDIQNPIVSENYVWFTATFSGEDALYRVPLNGGEPELVAEGHYGITEAWVDNEELELLFTELSPEGYRIKRAFISGLNIRQGIPRQNAWMNMADSLGAQVSTAWDSTKVLEEYEYKPYRKFPNLFNFHSWAPLNINVDDRAVNPGISVFSQNLLSTSFFEAGYAWLPQEDRGEWYTRWIYQGWYPRITAEYRTSHRTGQGQLSDGDIRDFDYQEHRLRLGADIPFRYQSGPYYYGAFPSVFVSHTLLNMDKDSPFEFRRDNNTSLDYRAYLYRRLKMGKRDLQPKWGQIVEFNYRHDPWYTQSGDIFAAEARLYFPGLARHHGLSIYGGYESKQSGQYDFSSFVNTPMGWVRHGEPEFMSFSADYRLPLLYPDLNLPGILFLKRIRAGVFADYAIGSYPSTEFDYLSTGAEIRMDAHFFRFIAPVDFGYRIAWLHELNDIAGEFLIGIDFTGF